jgi:nucleoside-diphosphate-sugar epimerase
MSKTLSAIQYLEKAVLGATGMDAFALRYGSLYGPGTDISLGGSFAQLVRKRMMPIVGDGAGVWSFLHVHDAANAAAAAVDRGLPGIYNIVDDEPAPVAAWLPELAKAVRAKPPFHIPLWIGKLALGDAGVLLMTQIRGASNAKAKRDLGWAPTFESWRRGFVEGLG